MNMRGNNNIYQQELLPALSMETVVWLVLVFVSSGVVGQTTVDTCDSEECKLDRIIHLLTENKDSSSDDMGTESKPAVCSCNCTTVDKTQPDIVSDSCADVPFTYTVGSPGGVFTVRVGQQRARVYCDMTTAGGGWLVIQRRVDASNPQSLSFNRTWNEYERGFGNVSGDFWLGLDLIYKLTSINNYKLRLDMVDTDDREWYAEYNSFRVGSVVDSYKISLGEFSGSINQTARRGLSSQNNRPFYTYDNQATYSSCAVTHGAGWWYTGGCHYANMNARYGTTTGFAWATGQTWIQMKASEMKITRI